MTIVDDIIKRAEAYPDRPAIISSSGEVVRYAQLPDVLPRDAGCELRTSGTTGRNKLVRIDPDQVKKKLARLEAVRGPGYVAMQSVLSFPMHTSPVWMHNALCMFLKGATVFVPLRVADAHGNLDLCETYGIEGLIFVPKILPFWKYLDVGHGYRFKYVFVNGGAATRKELAAIQSGLGGSVWVNYAATEVGPIAGGSRDDVGEIEGCVGHVAPGVEVEIDGGQIRVRCDTMADRYSDDAALSADRFKSGWFYPGDLGHFERGMLCIDGRV